jgi:hypothetical protein
VSPKNVNERYKSQAENSFPASRGRSFLRRRRQNGRWPHPAPLQYFVFISVRTEFFLEKYSYYSCSLNKAVNWETELQSHVARNGHCISRRMVQSLRRETDWTRRPASEYTVGCHLLWKRESLLFVTEIFLRHSRRLEGLFVRRSALCCGSYLQCTENLLQTTHKLTYI